MDTSRTQHKAGRGNGLTYTLYRGLEGLPFREPAGSHLRFTSLDCTTFDEREQPDGDRCLVCARLVNKVLETSSQSSCKGVPVVFPVEASDPRNSFNL